MDDSMQRVVDEVNACQGCDLYYGRSRPVPGAGSETAKVMFIGEGPGFHEDQQGIPFVGAAGKFLDELLEMIDLQRDDVYITNVVKCRPPGNRDPRQVEIDACRGFLDRQIALIQPKVIITLGRFSMARYFPNAKISQVHGQARKIEGILYYPMYHPAAALHQPSLRPVVVDDVARIPELIATIDDYPDSAPEQPATQLNLF